MRPKLDPYSIAKGRLQSHIIEALIKQIINISFLLATITFHVNDLRGMAMDKNHFTF